ncbi:MAG: hypothetical protein ACI4L9_04895, partial [Candidatus Coproplasma sp.]
EELMDKEVSYEEDNSDCLDDLIIEDRKSIFVDEAEDKAENEKSLRVEEGNKISVPRKDQ